MRVLTFQISSRHQMEIDRAVAELNAVGNGRVAGFECDVRDETQVRLYFAHTVERFGGVDILVNNAGIGMFRPSSR